MMKSKNQKAGQTSACLDGMSTITISDDDDDIDDDVTPDNQPSNDTPAAAAAAAVSSAHHSTDEASETSTAAQSGDTTDTLAMDCLPSMETSLTAGKSVGETPADETASCKFAASVDSDDVAVKNSGTDCGTENMSVGDGQSSSETKEVNITECKLVKGGQPFGNGMCSYYCLFSCFML